MLLIIIKAGVTVSWQQTEFLSSRHKSCRNTLSFLIKPAVLYTNIMDMEFSKSLGNFSFVIFLVMTSFSEYAFYMPID